VCLGEAVLVRMGGVGVCCSDLEAIDGYFEEYVPLKLPCILGHEIAGWVEETGSLVPQGIIEKYDLVVVSDG
jgi:D-arabinose 1-dehydrogenase-like Zn-dependent alcohol dehydrogenase